ncbi:hypothetical protein KKE26_01320 [bacterium]|nr:hypothetical protein [bacterium]MBU1752522.1 hypothetical protein [bacterium]
MRKLHIIIIVFIFLLTGSFAAQAQNSQRDEGNIERFARLETQMTAMNTRIDDLRSEMKGDMADLKGNMSDLKNELKGDIADLRGLVYVILGGIITLICGLLAMMGYVMWDRRTAITPVVRKTKELEQGFEDERVVLWKVLKGYARVEPRFAEVLKTAGIL